MKLLLIDEKYIKENSAIELNASGKVLNTIIWDIQKNLLKNILGKTLYTELLKEAKMKNDDEAYIISESSSELLFDYVQPYLQASTLTEFIVLNSYKLSNKGVLKLSDNNASALSADELEYFKNFYDNKKNVAENNLKEFIKCDEDITAPDADLKKTTGIGWYLDSNNFDDFYYRNSGKNKYL
ncbi:hypothetical protein [Pedobacter gandavensis]|uniref:DUF6712 family protein n=1 Tax=Pedobacter gandavensis TaxID=2679963 RepID=UPI00293165C2|nr:hypothetical protein [Pedobacter gandavensis]